MLTHPIIEKMRQLRFTGMAKAFEEQLQNEASHALHFEERLGLLVEREMALRESRRLQTRLTKAKFKQSACMEDIDYSAPRKLDKSLLLKLAECQWIRAHNNVLIIGATGTGKTYMACALAHKACLEGFSVRYHRMSRLLPEFVTSKSDGRYNKLMNDLIRTDVLILDDWGIMELNDENRRDLLEILDDRHGKLSTIVTSQLPLKLWYESIGDKTLADAIMDRLVHNAYRLEIFGESMRKVKANLTKKVGLV